MRHARGIGPLAAFVALASLVAGAGCVYDWDLGTTEGTSAGGDAGGADAGDSDAGEDAAAAGCDALVQKVEAARVAAKSCTLGASGQCGGSIVDECGCTSFVKDPQSPETSAFTAAVAELATSNCPASCPASCMLGMTGTCLLSAGKGPYCLP